MDLPLVLGFATHDDVQGAWWTVQQLVIHHYHAIKKCGLLIVDNSPDTQAGKTLQSYFGQWLFSPDQPREGERDYEEWTNQGWMRGENFAWVKYVPYTEILGTTMPREMVFREAKGKAVACLDGHITLYPKAVQKLLDYYAEFPETMDILSGPMTYDNNRAYATHFQDVIRDQMLGIWGQAWRCRCGAVFDVAEVRGQTVYRTLTVHPKHLYRCPGCNDSLPVLPWAGHEIPLEMKGYRPAAGNKEEWYGDPDSDPPREPVEQPAFEVPGMGLGLFSARKAAWQAAGGFNEKFRGFGGEEICIHERFRRAGGKAMCLPFLRWNHRFLRDRPITYNLSNWSKIRNLILDFTHLGWPLERLYRHFVQGINEDGTPVITEQHGRPIAPPITEEQWRILIEDPTNPPEEDPMAPKPIIIMRAGADGKPVPFSGPIGEAGMQLTLENLYEGALNQPSDINQHCPKLRELASQCGTVIEFGMRHGVSTVALLAGQPKRFISYDLNPDPIANALKLCEGATDFEFRMGSSLKEAIPECDLLFIDTEHTGPHVYAELTRHHAKVKRWIAFHDTQIYGERGPNSEPGLLVGIRQFLRERKEWESVYHVSFNNGLTVISRHPDDKPPKPANGPALASVLPPEPAPVTVQLGMQPQPPSSGPGTELKAILHSLGVDPGPSCDCNQRAEQMDKWGVDGCKRYRDEIVGWLKEGQTRWGWKEKLAIAAKAVTTGLAFSLSLLDPIPGLVDEAIRRAEEKENTDGVDAATAE